MSPSDESARRTEEQITGGGRRWTRRRRLMAAVAAAAAVVVLGGVTARVVLQRRAQAALREASADNTAVVQRGDLVTTVSASGYVVAANTADVRARVSGEVEAVLVSEGQWVTQGQVIARLVATEAKAAVVEAQDAFDLAAARLAEARAAQKATSLQLASQVESARHALLSAEKQLEELVKGQREEQLEQARSNLRSAEASLRSAQLELERLERLYEEGAVAKQQVEEARSRYETCLESKVTAEEKLKLATRPGTPDDIEAAKVLVAQAKAAYSAAVESRDSTDLTQQVKTAEAQWRQARNALDRARENLDATVIRAPISGTVVSVAVKAGDLVGTQGLVASLADTKRLQLEALVDETDIALVQVGQRVDVTSDSLPDTTVPGTVARISDVGSVKDNVVSFPVVVDLQPRAGEGPGLKVGATADAEIVVLERRGVLLLPRTAVVDRRGRTMVQSLGSGEAGAEPSYKRVELGATDGVKVEIVSGVEEGEVVVLPGQQANATGSSGNQTGGQGGSNSRPREFGPGAPGIMMFR